MLIHGSNGQGAMGKIYINLTKNGNYCNNQGMLSSLTIPIHTALQSGSVKLAYKFATGGALIRFSREGSTCMESFQAGNSIAEAGLAEENIEVNLQECTRIHIIYGQALPEESAFTLEEKNYTYLKVIIQ